MGADCSTCCTADNEGFNEGYESSVHFKDWIGEKYIEYNARSTRKMSKEFKRVSGGKEIKFSEVRFLDIINCTSVFTV